VRFGSPPGPNPSPFPQTATRWPSSFGVGATADTVIVRAFVAFLYLAALAIGSGVWGFQAAGDRGGAGWITGSSAAAVGGTVALVSILLTARVHWSREETKARTKVSASLGTALALLSIRVGSGVELIVFPFACGLLLVLLPWAALRRRALP